MEEQNNTHNESLRSMDWQVLIDTFIEHQRENFHQFSGNLTDYYQQFRLHLAEKSNQRYLFFTILSSLIFLTTISLILFEYRRLLKYLQRFFQFLYSYFLRLRNLLLEKTTPSLFNRFFNSKSHIREKFAREFVRSLNEELIKRKVKFIQFDMFSFFHHLYTILMWCVLKEITRQN